MFDPMTPLRRLVARRKGERRERPAGAAGSGLGPFECTLWHPAVLAVQRYVRRP